MAPVTLPIVRHFVREQAKVFLATTKLDLVKDGQPLPGQTDEKGNEHPHPLTVWWETAKEQMGLGLRLKRSDGYTVLFKTAGLRFGYTPEGRYTSQVVFPHAIRVVLDPSAPMDLDQAHLVAMEIASEAGLKGGGERRWECWCARAGEEAHFIVTERGEESVVIEWIDEGGPLRRPDGTAIVPLVFFTAHTEELGLFTAEESDLVPVNRALNVLVTDIHHIAEQQGFGVMVVTSPAGESPPAKIIRAPNTAISLSGGVDAKFINANAPLADLLALADRRIKQDAVLRGLPASAVSIEARAVSSGIALQIENRPLYEMRSDSIETYRGPMRRVWEIVRALEDAYGEENLDGVEMRWTPGDVQVPVDDAQKVDDVLAKLKAKLTTRVRAIAEIHGITLDEARVLMAEIDAEGGPNPEPADDPLGLKAKRDALAGVPMPMEKLDPTDAEGPVEPAPA